MISFTSSQTDRYINSTMEAAAESGVFCEVKTDFQEFLETCESLEGKSRPVSLFDPAANQIDETNGFWIKGTDASGKVVHVQAMSWFDTGTGSLAEYLEEKSRLFMIQDIGIDLGLSEFHGSLCTADLFGRIVYQGEIWLDKSKRGKSLTFLLPRMAIMLASAKWKPDYTFAFTSAQHAFKGLGIRYGYMHQQQDAIRWFVPDKSQYVEDWISWTSREEVSHQLKYLAADQRSHYLGNQPIGPLAAGA